MSVDRSSRDIVAERERVAARYRGIPVDAVCTGCKRIRVERVVPEELGLHPQSDPMQIDPGDANSFRRQCSRCGSTTWWNVVAVLEGLLESGRGDRK